MPGLLNSSAPASSPVVEKNTIWSTNRDEITFERLQKFWNELPIQARQELLRVDKQALFEQARKNLYCSRCNGLLLESFTQIVNYAKSLQQENAVLHCNNNKGSHNHCDSEDIQDPSIHPWGGLVATRDGILTLLDCFLYSRSLKSLQNVFDCARGREHEREILYPDACGGDGRGWTVHGLLNYGRGHGPRESCALHITRLSCDALLDFWSALGEETRTSLLNMKEEDFIGRLIYRFESKKFCRDCRRNVIREFKELKELKRTRKELLCTSWFCAADTAFQYQVTEDTVYADWQQCFAGTVGKYHHFEWGLGTCEGKSDILEFEDVGKSVKVQVNGLDLGDLNACFITLRAWKLDGRCTEICVKAHALKEQPCVHHRLMVGDGYVTITKGENIESFFEHAEEVEEEEDDDAMDKDGNEYIEGSHPQRHAKSPELAREFLLDAATVIFKEQVEKAFREGTARQNAHSMFVYLALKLLEDKIHVACKEIITLEKQNKLLEEEEKEKREVESKRERKRMKEREKKNRKKEKRKDKVKEKEKQNDEPDSCHIELQSSSNDASPVTVDSCDSVSDLEGNISSEENKVQELSNDSLNHDGHDNGKEFKFGESNPSYTVEQSKSDRRNLRVKSDCYLGRTSKWYENKTYHKEFDEVVTEGNYRPSRERSFRANPSSCNPRYIKKHQCSNNRTPKPLYRIKYNAVKQVWEPRSNSKTSIVPNQSDAVGCDKIKVSDNLNQVNNDSSNEKAELSVDNIKVSVGSGNPATSLCSSDNSSSYLSEGDNSSSKSTGNQNIELLSTTSDSEDVISPQSTEKIHDSGDKEQGNDVCNPDTSVFGSNNPPIVQNQITHPVIVPVFSVGYPNQNPITWQTPVFSHYNHYAYPPNPPLGYNEFTIPYSPIHPMTPLYDVPIHNISPLNNNGVYVTDPVEEIKYTSDEPCEKPTGNGQHPLKSKTLKNNEDKSFSLFHYDSPLAGSMEFKSNHQFNETDENSTMIEYSLFSGSRFLVF